jgi:hypothetical protein
MFCGGLTDPETVVVRAPFEHRNQRAGRPSPVIMATSGLHTARVPATEHRSSTVRSTQDTQTILSAVNLQVRGLL